MTRIGINGARGRMGLRIGRLVIEDENLELILALEYDDHKDLGKNYGAFLGKELNIKVEKKFINQIDVLIDFSSPEGLKKRIEDCLENKIPLVCGTTGLDQSLLEEMQKGGESIPIVYGTNMSLGINLLRRLVRETAEALGDDFDVEIVETHHHHKKDAPSGTCMTLFEDIRKALHRKEDCGVYGRKGIVGPRRKKEIGLHALRLGSVVGEHSVYFASEGEIIEIKHQALSRDSFAEGAIKAAKWIQNKEKGFYSMEDVLFG